MAEVEPRVVRPLGVFAPDGSRRPVATRAILRGLAGGLPQELRGRVVDYLGAGTGIVPFMEYTRDILEGRFGVSGGSALMSDGVYYWRDDAKDYIREYGIGLPQECLQHMAAQGWRPPALDEATEDRVYRYLYVLLGARPLE